MRAYSTDLRLKVLDAVDRGMPRKEVARHLWDLAAFDQALAEQAKGERRRAELPIPGPPAREGGALAQWLPYQLEATPI